MTTKEAVCKRIILSIFSLLVLCRTAGAQDARKAILSAADAGTCTANSTACSFLAVPSGSGGVTFTITTNASANTVQFEATGDTEPTGSHTWVALSVFPSNATTSVTSTTSTGTWQANVAGFTQVRLRMSTFVGGTTTTYINLSTASARVGGGGGLPTGCTSPGAGAITCTGQVQSNSTNVATINSTQFAVPYVSSAPSGLAGVPAPTTPDGIPFTFCSTPSGGIAALPAWCWPGVAVNAQTGATYTVAYTDRGGIVTDSNVGATAVTLPQAGSVNFANNFNFGLFNINTGLVTITPTTSTINGSATQIVPNKWGSFIYSDPANNYRALTIPDIGAFPSCADSGGNHLNFTTATGAISCGTSSGGGYTNLFQNGVNALDQRNGVNGQSYFLYNTYTDASNYENFQATWSAGNIYLVTGSAGTGVSRIMHTGTLGTANFNLMTNTSDRWTIEGANPGNFIASTDNVNDIGKPGANRPRTIYSATSVVSPFTVPPALIHQTAQTAAITTATLCAATAGLCNTAGNYTVEWAFTETGTACATPTAGGVTFLLTWTDQNGTAHSAISLPMDDSASLVATSGTFTFRTTLAAAWASGNFNISSNGSIIQYATGYTACGVGTGTYQLDAWVTRKQ